MPILRDSLFDFAERSNEGHFVEKKEFIRKMGCEQFRAIMYENL